MSRPLSNCFKYVTADMTMVTKEGAEMRTIKASEFKAKCLSRNIADAGLQEDRLFVSAISFWEIALLARRGRLV